MGRMIKVLGLALIGVCALVDTAFGLDAAVQAKIDAKLAVISVWGKDAGLVGAVKSMNTTPLAEAASMTQETWEKLTVLDPKVRIFQTNEIGAFLKAHKEPWMSEGFVSLANGTKAGFLMKTSSWSHKGKPKHDVPMTGKTWQGEVEFDKSAGRDELQVSVPVLDGDTPIGSLVVGLDIGKL